MEKKKKLIKLIESNVNYTGYGISNNFIGYCERNGPFQKAHALTLIGIFDSFFSGENICIVNSVEVLKDQFIDDNLGLSQELEVIENRLVQRGFIKFSDYEDEYINGYHTSISNPKFKVVLNFDDQTLSDFSLLFFVDSRIEGHCFFVMEKLGLIAYPHEDTGFGFIGVDGICENSREKVVDFFEALKTDNFFRFKLK